MPRAPSVPSIGCPGAFHVLLMATLVSASFGCTALKPDRQLDPPAPGDAADDAREKDDGGPFDAMTREGDAEDESADAPSESAPEGCASDCDSPDIFGCLGT